MDRRSFLRAAGFGTAFWCAGRLLRGARTRSAAGRLPNILVIMSDEHNVHVTGCYGNQLVRTTHLDGLARRGVVFDAAYTNSPLCVPARLAFTSGKYVSRVGAWNNSSWLPSAEYPSLPRIMNAAGYDSVLCGKMHYDRTRRYGFREIGGNMNNSLKTGGGLQGRLGPETLPEPRGDTSRFGNFFPSEESSVLKHDRRVTAAACEFLAGRKKDDRPFFLLAGYLAPHFPLIVPQEFWDRYKGKVPMPQIPEGHLAAQPRNYEALRRGFRVCDPPAETVRKGRELYYGLTEWLDAEVGKVLKALAGSEAADDTVVIYTTDHGENMGEHGLWWKNCMYEQAARVPLIVAWPKRWAGGQRRTGACSHLDVVQTIAELGGAAVPSDWNGDSLRAWLDDPKASWKDQAVSEYYAHNIVSGFAMIRRGRYKYVYHTARGASHPAQRELYDLAADPGEFANLAGKPEHRPRIEELHAALVKELGEDPERIELRCRADYERGYGRGNARKNAKKGANRGAAASKRGKEN